MSVDAAVQQAGWGPNDAFLQQIDPTFYAGRVSLKPLEYQAAGGVQGGHYRLATSYSSTAAKPAAGSDIFSLRWADPTKLFVLKRFLLYVATTTTYTASAVQDAALYKATGFTAAASSGTAVSIAVGGKLQSSRMAISGIATGGTGLAWISSGDLLTVGTRTLDTYPVGYGAWLNAITTINAPSALTLFDSSGPYDHPVVLGLNEGLVLQTPIGNGQAAGVSKFTVIMDWAEVPSF
jgi:hypothetical protein